jgi:hypothetical protein
MQISMVISSRETGRNATPSQRPGPEMTCGSRHVQEDLIVGVEPGAIRVRKMIHEDLQPLTVTVRRRQMDVQRIPAGSIDSREELVVERREGSGGDRIQPGRCCRRLRR